LHYFMVRFKTFLSWVVAFLLSGRDRTLSRYPNRCDRNLWRIGCSLITFWQHSSAVA
jgi:hypothetical protein